MDQENQATLLLLQRLIKAQPDAPNGQIANVLAQYSEVVTKEVKTPAPRQKATEPGLPE